MSMENQKGFVFVIMLCSGIKKIPHGVLRCYIAGWLSVLHLFMVEGGILGQNLGLSIYVQYAIFMHKLESLILAGIIHTKV